MFQVVILKAVIFAYRIGNESTLQKVQISNIRMLEVAGGHELANKGFPISPILTIIRAK